MIQQHLTTIQTLLNDAFGFTDATPIQKAAMPLLLEEKNLALQSATGSGKTLAYLLPLVLLAQEKKQRVLIVVPTQELALQIVRVARALAESMAAGFYVASLVGGANVRHQLDALKKDPTVMVGTLGRVIELFDRKKLKANTICAVVFDEADALTKDYKGRESVATLRRKLLRDTQTVAVSASLDSATLDFFNKFVPMEPLQISETLPEHISHYSLACEPRKKIEYLRRLIAYADGASMLIFLNQPDQIERTVEKLQHHHIHAEGLHAEKGKSARAQALKAFREGKANVLVTSDVSARGIDIPSVDIVVHVDLPLDPTTYLHRAGRTGRNGNSGASIVLVAGKEVAPLRIYARDLGLKVEPVHLKNGLLIEGEAPQAPNPKENKDDGKKKKKKSSKPNKQKGAPKRHQKKKGGSHGTLGSL